MAAYPLMCPFCEAEVANDHQTKECTECGAAFVVTRPPANPKKNK